MIGASDYVPYNIWHIMFMNHKGYLNKSNMFFQDNQSAMRMERNGMTSCTGNSRHISIRYIFITDRVGKGDLRVLYFFTHLMLIYYFTKPLQGALFNKFMDIIMIIASPYILLKDITSSSRKESVDNQIPE